jgi:hypothetical protein
MQKYQSEVIKANDAFAHNNTYIVEVVYTDRRHYSREYFPRYFYSEAKWEAWNTAVNNAVSNYSNDAKAAYNNACVWG